MMTEEEIFQKFADREGDTFVDLGDEHFRETAFVSALTRAAEAGHLATLRHLVFDGTVPVGDAVVTALARLAETGHLRLGSLSLLGTSVGDAGVTALARAAETGHLTRLRELDLSFTRVGDAGVFALSEASAAGCLRRLDKLGLTETQVRSVDEAVLESGRPGPIFAALRDGVVLPVARVLFVGTGHVGKSWLFERCFLDRVVDNNRPREQTADINLIRPEVCVWMPTLASGTRVEPRVWDFGGQLVLHGVHETFLGDDGRTVYVLVLSANETAGSRYDDGEERGNAVAYWLRMIHHFGGSAAPVVVAVTQNTKAASAPRPVDTVVDPFPTPVCLQTPADLAERFGLKVTRVVDKLSACDAQLPVEPLRDAINDAVAECDAIAKNKKVPPKLVPVRRKVEEELSKRSLVDVETFREWCAACDVTDPGEQDAMRSILHHMGCLFYFGWECWSADRRPDDMAPGQRRFQKRDRDFSLEKYAINPAWLKYAAYSVVKESERREWLPRADVQAKVRDADREVQRAAPGFPFEPHPDGGKVVEAFLKLVELSFYDTEAEKYLFPRGLKPGIPSVSATWPRAWLQWTFVPESAFHRFMVRMHNIPGRVPKSKGVFEHGRDWVMLHVCEIQVVVSLDSGQARIGISFDPASKPTDRAKAFDILREVLIGEVGKPPTAEQPPTDAPATEEDTLRRQIAEAKEEDWESAEDAADHCKIDMPSLYRRTRRRTEGDPGDFLRLDDNAGRTSQGIVWRRKGKKYEFLKSTLR